MSKQPYIITGHSAFVSIETEPDIVMFHLIDLIWIIPFFAFLTFVVFFWYLFPMWIPIHGFAILMGVIIGMVL